MKCRKYAGILVSVLAVASLFTSVFQYETPAQNEYQSEKHYLRTNNSSYKALIKRMDIDAELLGDNPDFSQIERFSVSDFTHWDDDERDYEDADADAVIMRKSLLFYIRNYLSAEKKDGFVINNGILLDYVGKKKTITIPSSVNTIMGFHAHGLKKVYIPDSVSYMADTFDNDCAAECVFLPRNGESLTIGGYCFDGDPEDVDESIEISLPEEISSIGNNSFCGQYSVTIPTQLTSIGSGSFCHCERVVILSDLPVVEKGCFSDCNEIRIDGTIGEVRDDAFSNDKLIWIKGGFLSVDQDCIDVFCGSGIFLDKSARLPEGFSFEDYYADVYNSLPPYFIDNPSIEIKQFHDKYLYDKYIFNPAYKKLGMKTDNSSVIRIIDNNEIRALKPGTARLIIKAENGSESICTVRVKKTSITKKVNSIIKKSITKNMTTEQKVTKIANYLEKYIKYGTTGSRYGKDAGKADARAHTAEGALLDGRAVCQGQAEAFRDVMDVLGIECVIKYNNTHGWDLVRIGKKWTNVDITLKRYGTDEYFKKLGYDWDEEDYPKATYRIKALVSDGKTD